jgi:ABC-type uncharacterized transport system permease subunit
MAAFATPLSILLYLAAAASLVMEIRKGLTQPGLAPSERAPIKATPMRVLATMAMLLQFMALTTAGLSSGGVDMSLSSMASLICAVIVLMFLAGTFLYPVERLGIILLPAVAILLAAMQFVGTEPIFDHEPSSALLTHIFVSVLAYALLTLAAVQAFLVIMQEKQLHQVQSVSLLTMLPPAETMDTVLFRLIGTGFGLLTLTLLTGMGFSQQLFGIPFAFTHHIVLSCVAWVLFAALLVGRYRAGWRGRRAAHWTLWGFGILALGYFGTKIVMLLI